MPLDVLQVENYNLELVSTFCYQHFATLTLMYVIDPAIMPRRFRVLNKSNIEVMKLIKIGKNQLNEIAMNIRSNHDIIIDNIVQIGDEGKEICDFAVKKGYNLIVLPSPFLINHKMLTHDESMTILRHAPCPVLLIPPA